MSIEKLSGTNQTNNINDLINLFNDTYRRSNPINNGDNLVILAVAYGDKEMVEILLNNGCDVNQIDNHGWTPLHYAASNRLEEIIKVLIDYGADRTIKDIWGNTPIDLAIYRESLPILENYHPLPDIKEPDIE
jgi:ankyrin repeat protein